MKPVNTKAKTRPDSRHNPCSVGFEFGITFKIAYVSKEIPRTKALLLFRTLLLKH